eukprot:scaffold1.g5564.t1
MFAARRPLLSALILLHALATAPLASADAGTTGGRLSPTVSAVGRPSAPYAPNQVLVKRARAKAASDGSAQASRVEAVAPKPGETVAAAATRLAAEDGWGLARIGIPAVWDSAATIIASGAATQTIKVCVVDSGVDSTHPDLKDSLVAGMGWKQHLQVLACRFLGPDNVGFTSKAIDCLNWCMSNGARVITASWTGSSQQNSALEDAFSSIGDAGGMVIVAAGNEATNLETQDTYPAFYSTYMPHVITVGASNESDPAERAWDFVAGAAGTLFALNPKLTPAQVRSLLLSTAQPTRGLAGMSQTGGVLRLDLAVKQLAAQLPKPKATQPTANPAGQSGLTTPRPAPLTQQQPSPGPKYKVVITTVVCAKPAPGCTRKCKLVRDARCKLVRKCALVRNVVKKVKVN